MPLVNAPPVVAEICPLLPSVSAVVIASNLTLPPSRVTLIVPVSLSETVVPLPTLKPALAASLPSFSFHAKFLNWPTFTASVSAVPVLTLVILPPFILIPPALRVGPLSMITEVKFGLVLKPIWTDSPLRYTSTLSPTYLSAPLPQRSLLKMLTVLFSLLFQVLPVPSLTVPSPVFSPFKVSCPARSFFRLSLSRLMVMVSPVAVVEILLLSAPLTCNVPSQTPTFGVFVAVFPPIFNVNALS